MQKYDQKIFAFTQQSNSNFLEFLVEIFLNVISHKLEEIFTLFEI